MVLLLLPCVLRDLDGCRGFLWTTTIGARGRPYRRVVEVITDADLRGTYRLADGDRVAVELPG